MEQIMRIFAGTTSVDDPQQFCKLRSQLFKAFVEHFGVRAKEGDGYIEIKKASKDDVCVIENTSKRVGIGYKYVVEREFSKRELKRHLSHDKNYAKIS